MATLSMMSTNEPLSEAAQFLVSAGLTPADAHHICEISGADTANDLAYIGDDAATISKQAGLKLVPAKKFAQALQSIPSAAAPKIANPLPAASVDAHVADKSPATTLPRPGNQEKTTKPPKPVQECVAICIDRSGSMGSGFDEMAAWCDDGNQNALDKTLQRRSRMDAVKQVFYAFRDRTSTLGAGVHKLGLLQFDSEVEEMMDLSTNLELFEAIVDDMQKRGTTAIYSAIIQATEMLAPAFRDHPDADLRVLVLTDGKSNAGASPETALDAVYQIGAVVDAIIVGNSPDANLRKIVNATGGSCYQIKTLSEGFELMEAEAVVSLRARRGGTDKPKYVRRTVNHEMFHSIAVKEIVRGNQAAQVAAAAAPRPVTARSMVSCSELFSNGHKSAKSGGSSAEKRVLQELSNVASGKASAFTYSGEGIHIFPDSNNPLLMKALLEGPAGSPFEGGVFAMDISVPTNYPFRAPSMTFHTPVYHCNVSDSGRICLDILHDAWSPSMTVPKVLEAIRIMLGNPEPNHALRQWIAELTIMHRKSGGADSRYVDAARAATAKNASRSVEDWRKHWASLS